MRMLLIIFMIIALPGLGIGYAGSKIYQFGHNDPKKKMTATDIHIKFTRAVYWDQNDSLYTWQSPMKTFTDCDYHEGYLNVVDFDKGDDGKGVPFGTTVYLTLSYNGEPAPTIVEWYFTYPNPTLSEWGLIVIVLLLLTAGAIVIRRRRARA